MTIAVTQWHVAIWREPLFREGHGTGLTAADQARQQEGANTVPNDETDDFRPDEPSPARNAVRKWKAVWQGAGAIQEATGRAGHLTDWDEAFEVSNQFATLISRELTMATIAGLANFETLLEFLEWLTIRLRSLVTHNDPQLDGALLAAAERIEDLLGMPPAGLVDIRDVFPKLGEAAERRFAEQDAVINYWAAFASGRTQQITMLREDLEELRLQMATPATTTALLVEAADQAIELGRTALRRRSNGLA